MLRSKTFLALLSSVAWVAMAASAAAVPRPDQSDERPLGFQVYGPVHHSGSDARSAEFNANVLPEAMALVEANLGERDEFEDRHLVRLDPDRLYLFNPTDRPVRIYFLNEGAGYRNTLGFSATLAGSPTEGQRYLLIPDVSDGTFAGPDLLEPGDWVEFGEYPAAVQFEFFIIRDGVRGGSNIFTANDQENEDGLQHMVAWLIQDRYVLIGFEDILGGGDLDYNDVVFVADLGPDLGLNVLPLPK
ncbi:MAG: DUF4114 domain-containing protein [Planctomycetota bacterium]